MTEYPYEIAYDPQENKFILNFSADRGESESSIVVKLFDGEKFKTREDALRDFKKISRGKDSASQISRKRRSSRIKHNRSGRMYFRADDDIDAIRCIVETLFEEPEELKII